MGQIPTPCLRRHQFSVRPSGTPCLRRVNIPVVSRIELICSKRSNFSARVPGVSSYAGLRPGWYVLGLPTSRAQCTCVSGRSANNSLACPAPQWTVCQPRTMLTAGQMEQQGSTTPSCTRCTHGRRKRGTRSGKLGGDFPQIRECSGSNPIFFLIFRVFWG